MKYLYVLAFGYLLSWLVHGRLIKRIRDTHYYITKRKYSLATAWNLAGRTL